MRSTGDEAKISKSGNFRSTTSMGQRNRLALATGPDGWTKPPMVFGIRCGGQLDAALLAESLTWMTRRHSALRMFFPDTNEPGWAEIVPPAEGTWPLTVMDLTAVPAGEHASVEADAIVQLSKPIDLTSPPLLRAVLLSNSNNHLLGLAIDHAVFDGQSISVLFRDLSFVYEHLAQGGDTDVLNALVSDYVAFAAAESAILSTDRGKAELAYWAETWRDVGPYPPLRLPVRPAWRETGRGQCWTKDLNPEELQAFTHQARRWRLSPYMLTSAALVTVLRNLMSDEDTGLITPYARRYQPVAEHTVGYFNSRMLLRVRAPKGSDFGSIAQLTKEATLQGLRNGTAGFDALMRHFYPDLQNRRPTEPYLFLNVIATPTPPTLTGLHTEFVWLVLPAFYEQFPGLTISLDHQENWARLSCGYHAARYDDNTIDMLMNQMVQVMLNQDV